MNPVLHSELNKDRNGKEEHPRGVRQTLFGDDGNCLRAAVATITGLRLEDVVDVLDGVEPEERWYEQLRDWAVDHGWHLEVCAPTSPPRGLALACGHTTRSDQTHAVVVKDGRPWWDPHPSDLFLDGDPTYFISFERR